MAWDYSDWILEPTIEQRWTKFLIHYNEVSNAISAKVQSDGTMVDPTTVLEYFKLLNEKKNELDPGGDTGHGGGSRITRGRIIKL